MSQHTLTLERPLVVFDLETTGLDVHRDRIVEVCCVRIAVDGTRHVFLRRVNPGIPIAAGATEIHGISNADVQHEPPFEQIAGELFELLDGCDVSGFNVEQFDLPLLVEEFERAGIEYPRESVHVVDSRKIYLSREPRDLASAYKLYCGKELIGAHTARADALAAAEILLAQVERYEELPRTVDELCDACLPAHDVRSRRTASVINQTAVGSTAQVGLAAMLSQLPRWLLILLFVAIVGGIWLVGTLLGGS